MRPQPQLQPLRMDGTVSMVETAEPHMEDRISMDMDGPRIPIIRSLGQNMAMAMDTKVKKSHTERIHRTESRHTNGQVLSDFISNIILA